MDSIGEGFIKTKQTSWQCLTLKKKKKKKRSAGLNAGVVVLQKGGLLHATMLVFHWRFKQKCGLL